MKTLIAYGYADEDPKIIEPYLIACRNTLIEKGIQVDCTFFDVNHNNKNYSHKQWMEYAFNIIDDCDFLFVLHMSSRKSEGMLMEVGYCLGKNIPILTATRNGLRDTYLPEMANKNIFWDETDDLIDKIHAFNFDTLV